MLSTAASLLLECGVVSSVLVCLTHNCGKYHVLPVPPHHPLQTAASLILFSVSVRVCYLVSKRKQQSTSSGSQIQSSNAQTGGWPQYQFAFQSALAGFTGVIDAILSERALNARIAAFCRYYNPACTAQKSSSAFEDFVSSAVIADLTESGSYLSDAVQGVALNFIQLILIQRFVGTLVVADSNWSWRVQTSRLYRFINQFPAVLRCVIVLFGALNVVLRCAEFALSVILSQRTPSLVKSLNSTSMLDASVADIVQVNRMGQLV